SPTPPPPSLTPSLVPPHPPTPIPTLSLHDALPIWKRGDLGAKRLLRLVGAAHARERVAAVEVELWQWFRVTGGEHRRGLIDLLRSEEHTSELQSLAYLVCRLLLEKKKI